MWLLRSVIKVMEVIYNEAEKEYYDETPYRQALEELHEQLMNGEITEVEYEEEEEKIIEIIKEIRTYKKEHGIGEE